MCLLGPYVIISSARGEGWGVRGAPETQKVAVGSDLAVLFSPQWRSRQSCLFRTHARYVLFDLTEDRKHVNLSLQILKTMKICIYKFGYRWHGIKGSLGPHGTHTGGFRRPQTPPQRAPKRPQAPPGEGPTRAKKGPRAIAPNYAPGLTNVQQLPTLLSDH